MLMNGRSILVIMVILVATTTSLILWATHTSSYSVVLAADAISPGNVVQASDVVLGHVRGSPSADSRTISSTIGRIAVDGIAAGSAIPLSSLAPPITLGPGDSIVTLAMPSIQVPLSIRAGERVAIVEVAGGPLSHVEVITVATVGILLHESASTTRMDLVVSDIVASTVVALDPKSIRLVVQ
jgi:flagella basal body P-ring formation protein FlgA